MGAFVCVLWRRGFSVLLSRGEGGGEESRSVYIFAVLCSLELKKWCRV
jgi:hypothetical protein